MYTFVMRQVRQARFYYKQYAQSTASYTFDS